MIEMKERKKGLGRFEVCVCVCARVRRIDLLLVRRGGRLVEVDWDRPVKRRVQWKPHCCVVAFPVCSRNCTLIKLPSSTYIIVSFLTSLSLFYPLFLLDSFVEIFGFLKKKKNRSRFAKIGRREYLIIFNESKKNEREAIKPSSHFSIYPDISIEMWGLEAFITV